MRYSSALSRLVAIAGLALAMSLAACGPVMTGTTPTSRTGGDAVGRVNTPSPTPINTPQPGLLIRGYVRLPDGSGVSGVSILRSYASYPGQVVAVTDQDGYYESRFQHIPGDEMVRVWAELEAYSFAPARRARSWEGGAFYWRHYHGYEDVTLSFVARPA